MDVRITIKPNNTEKSVTLNTGGGDDEQEPTKISYQNGKAIADPLTSNRKIGTAPGKLDGWEHAQILNKKHDSWVKGHMVSQDFGGEGTARNMSILTKTNNSGMSVGPEQYAKDETAKGKKLAYETKWENHPEKGKIKNFAKKVDVTIKEYKNGNKVKVKSYPFTQAQPPETVAGVKFNLNEIGRPTMMTQFGVAHDFALDLLEVRKKGKFSDLIDIEDRLSDYYESNNIDKGNVKWKNLDNAIAILENKLKQNNLVIK